MPKIVSKAQFRLVRAIASARRKVRTAKSLTAASARRGLAEFKRSGRSYASLPERKGG